MKRGLRGHQLLTLTGPPGVGKTRLALRVAADLGGTFPDGVHFVPLDGVRDPTHVLPTIADSLGIEAGSARPLPERMSDHLAGRRVLLVLDNFEHLVDAAPGIPELLSACPHVKAMVTSRRALEVYGERELAVEPLALPPDADPRQRHPGAAAVRIGRYEAVRLFVERARDVWPQFELTEQNAEHVAELCRRLDGLPLAIELAARRMRSFSASAMLAHLAGQREHHGASLLSDGAQDLPPRHQTLRRAIEVSYELLDPEARRLFRHVCVFTGGFTQEAAAAVYSAADVLAGVDGLVVASMVQRQEVAGGTRFRVLETLREHGVEQLVAEGEEPDARRRQAEYYLRMGERLIESRAGSTRRDTARLRADLDAINTEIHNVRAALRWLVDSRQRELAGRLTYVLYFPLLHLGHVDEARRHVDAVLELGGPAEGDWAPIRAMMLHAAADMAVQQGDYAACPALQEEALAIWRARDDTRMIASVLSALGGSALRLHKHDRARTLLTEAMTRFRQLGDEHGAATALGRLGMVAQDLGDVGEAVRLYEQAAATLRGTGDPYILAWILVRQGFMELEQGRVASARAMCTEARALREALDDHLGLVRVLSLLASVVAAESVAGGPAVARRALELAGAVVAQTGDGRVSLKVVDYHFVERWLEVARRLLGEPEAAAAWERGLWLSLDQALRLGAAGPAAAGAPAESGRRMPTGSRGDELTAREREVAAMMAGGKTNREIAEALTIAESTAGLHAKRVLGKLGLRSRAQLAARVEAMGGLLGEITETS